VAHVKRREPEKLRPIAIHHFGVVGDRRVGDVL
jgi:hypothetical protein